MDKQFFKQAIYQEIATIGKALSNPYRLRIVNILSQGDYSVDQIATELNISIANASQHLQVLKKSKLVTSHKKGHYVIYSLPNTDVHKLWNALQNFGLTNSLEVKSTLETFKKQTFAEVPSITIDELLKEHKLTDICFLDVRPEKEFKKAAIANAVSVPVEKISDHIRHLPKEKQIVVYCRGPLCVFADEAVLLLKEKGYDAIRLEEDVLSWEYKGLPVN
ncbi:ArsR/SmtB family transcription factor [Aquimarina hainanensis]|uniref:ArsR/SmtB family transcription factor n=1 Tax=Aquimarina hainanensis TaxID=1578017 RepID=A0ABW5ND95_9FLAO